MISKVQRFRTRDRAVLGVELRLLALFSVLLGLTVPSIAQADTTAETGITVTTENAGTFAISFEGGDPEVGYTFVDSTGNAEIPVSAVEGNTATVFVTLAWDDTRADGARTPYTISISATDLTSMILSSAGGVYSISNANLRISGIGDHTPEAPLPLSAPQTIFTSPLDPAAGNGSLTLTLQLDIPPSTYPATYTATLTVSVTFLE